jgi:hypothetical protein
MYLPKRRKEKQWEELNKDSKSINVMNMTSMRVENFTNSRGLASLYSFGLFFLSAINTVLLLFNPLPNGNKNGKPLPLV